MKKIVLLSGLLVLCFSSLTYLSWGRGGGESFAGGLAGGMFGGLMSGAMTRGASSERSASISASVMREIDKLENAVRYDLIKLDERIKVLERESGKGGFADAQDLKEDLGSLKKSLRKVETNIESKIEALEDRVVSMDKKLKKMDARIKNVEGKSTPEEPETKKESKLETKLGEPVAQINVNAEEQK